MASNFSLNAQGRPDFDMEWKRVDKLMENRSYRSAYNRCQQLLDSAEAMGCSREMLNATLYLCQAGNAFREKAADSTHARMLALLPKLEAHDQSVAHLLLSRFYGDYLYAYRWQIVQNGEVDDEEADFRLWSKRRLEEQQRLHLQLALNDSLFLQQASVLDYPRLLQEGSGPATRSLFDVAVALFADLTDLPQMNSYGDWVSTEALFGDLASFAAMALPDDDNGCWQTLRLMQQQARLALGEAPTEKGITQHMIFLDLQRLELLEEHFADPGGEVVLEGLARCTAFYRSRPDNAEAAKFLFLGAQRLERCDSLCRALEWCERGTEWCAKGEGRSQCLGMKKDILQPSIRLNVPDVLLCQQPQLASVESRNIDSLFLRIVPYRDFDSVPFKQQTAWLLKQPCLHAWCQPTTNRGCAGADRTAIYLPALPAGRFFLVVSDDGQFPANRISYSELCCDPVQWVDVQNGDGLLLDRRTGRPMAGQVIHIQHPKEEEGLPSAVRTDSLGFFHIDIPRGAYFEYHDRISTVVDGFTSYAPFVPRSLYGAAEGERYELADFLNKPVYRLGERVEFACLVLSQYDAAQAGRTLQGHRIEATLIDPNGRTLAADSLVTDANGRCHGAFVLPSEGLNGDYSLALHDVTANKHRVSAVRVEAFKQPKFMVSLPADGALPHFDQPLRIEGRAQSYSGVPLDGARFSYQIERRLQMPWWRYGYARSDDSPQTVAAGAGVIREDGSFDFCFTPEADSNADLSGNPFFLFSVSVVVTDLNGESHDALRLFRIGRVNSGVNILSQDDDHWEALRFDYLNLDDQPLAGSLQVRIEELALPDHPALPPTGVGRGLFHQLPQEAFRQRFPLLTYRDDENDPASWAVRRTLVEQTYVADGEGCCSLPLPKGLGSGVYRVTITADGERYSKTITITAPDERHCLHTELMWCQPDSLTAAPGHAISVRLGSRFKDVTVIYRLCQGDKVLKCGSLRLDEEMKRLTIPVTDDERGRVRLSLIAMRDNHLESQSFDFEVPFAEQKLEIEKVSFRDKMMPGAQERWCFRVSRQGNPTAAALIATLYDDALTEYAYLQWVISPELVHTNWMRLSACNPPLHWKGITFERPGHDYYHWDMRPYYLKSLLMERGGRNGALYCASTKVGTRNEDIVMETEEEEAVFMSTMEPVAKNGVGTDRASGDDRAAPAASRSDASLRSQLSTAAFFLPELSSDADSGLVALSFTAPELLTRWNLHLQAWTPDLAVGGLKLQSLTQKELMVQPNLPRFLRQGDVTTIACKVSNLGAADRRVSVTLELRDAQNDSLLFCQSQPVEVPAGRNAAVSFSLPVPDGTFVAQYRVMARSEGVGDGEQGLLPVLTNRELVTESLSLFLNGEEEKHYVLAHLQQADSPTLVHHGLKLECCSNPMWYAIQSIPYLASQESPSMVYLANLLYVDHLGRKLMDDNPQIESMLQHWNIEEPEALTSKLACNADVKQTLLEESPWLQQADDESEQMRQLADFYQRDKLDLLLGETERKLLEGQMDCGGWGWMPDSREADLWTTERILLKMGELQHRGVSLSSEMQRALERALDWSDKEEQRIYAKYIKKMRCFDATDILYLYARSFYDGSAAPECYRFYYKNALKHFNEYEDLYARAQLALIFQRHGDRHTARRMAVALKECALYSEELGMYWRDNVGGYWWHRRPVETQALLIEMMHEVEHDALSVAQMQQWLLKQRQTTCWNSDVATTQAIAALMVGADSCLLADGADRPVRVSLGGKPVTATPQSGTGYFSQQWKADEISPEMGEVSMTKVSKGIAWGALYWQYFEDMDKIPASEMGIRLQKVLFRYQQDGSLQRLEEDTPVRVGDRLMVRILIHCDRNMEYLELRDPRGAGLEPVSSHSGWLWNDGLSYYVDVHDASSRFFINRMEKGDYVLEYDLWANNAGSYSLGSASMQCMYAPEFRSNTAGTTITILDE